MKTGKVLLGLLAGVAVGATLGILFAPDKGKETRTKISKKSDDYATELEEKFSKFINSVAGKFESVKEDVVRATENGKIKAEEAVDDIWDSKASIGKSKH